MTGGNICFHITSSSNVYKEYMSAFPEPSPRRSSSSGSNSSHSTTVAVPVASSGSNGCFGAVGRGSGPRRGSCAISQAVL